MTRIHPCRRQAHRDIPRLAPTLAGAALAGVVRAVIGCLIEHLGRLWA
ncbi:hypothetical protein FB563_6668 [Streptomyces puniciscabiei]|uniref:Uncharacterized protein n=1 Tax=Streptomyces puniciscabiei TaxID=164348 RepID=A0A542TI66_9ACTN|nr:hypothetical protein [Streptomyces puniciscabiei]TQK86525.1 hypothetical protein FB563_6668 [Streptomyces puniciscabiei]